MGLRCIRKGIAVYLFHVSDWLKSVPNSFASKNAQHFIVVGGVFLHEVFGCSPDTPISDKHKHINQIAQFQGNPSPLHLK